MGYANGSYEWSAADWARFPDAQHVSIDVNGTDPGADVLDIETGDATVGHAPSWAKLHNEIHPTSLAVLYANRSTLTPLFNAMAANKLTIGKDFLIGIATLDGTKTVKDMTGVAFVQYAGQDQTGHHYDESIVYDDAWKPEPKPTPPPPPKPPTPPTAGTPITKPPAPPGDWLDGTFVGRSTNGRLYRADYDSATGKWTADVELP